MKLIFRSVLFVLWCVPSIGFAHDLVPHAPQAEKSDDAGFVLGAKLGGVLLQDPLVFAPGGALILGYEIPQTLMYLELGGFGFDNDDVSGGASKFDLGVRRYLSSADISLFVGGGMGIGTYSLDRDTDERDEFGVPTEESDIDVVIEPFVEGGVELFRTKRVRTTFGLRAGIPIGSVGSNIPIGATMGFSYKF